MKPVRSILLIFMSLSQTLSAQDLIQITGDEINLMGIEFSAVTEVGRQLGIQLPAHVIAAPNTETAVINRFSGVVERWETQAGEDVVAGDVLAVVRSMDFMSMQQGYLEHWSELQLAQQKLDRDKMLWQQGIISESRYQQSDYSLSAARTRVRGSESQLAAGGLGEQELQALREGEAELGLVLIRSAIDGSLAQRSFAIGDSIGASTAIARLAQSSTPWVAIQVPARLLGLLSPSTQLSTAGGESTLTLRARDYVINSQTQSAEILAQFSSASPLILGQMLNVVIHPSPSALMIPAQAVVHEGAQTLVYVNGSQGIEPRSLELIPVGDGYLAQAGVSVGEQLVTKGAALVKGMQLGLGQ
jgi:cobalt-zinc-cadmium efflux system membrane fusion protein